MIPVVPHERVDCHVSSEEGEIHCDGTGVCKSVVSFSNQTVSFHLKSFILHVYLQMSLSLTIASVTSVRRTSGTPLRLTPRYQFVRMINNFRVEEESQLNNVQSARVMEHNNLNILHTLVSYIVNIYSVK